MCIFHKGTIIFCYSADINECVERPDICGVGNKCQNVYAGHECICSDAYALSDDRKSCIGKNYIGLLQLNFDQGLALT